MKMYTQEELHAILKNHKHWLNQDCDDWEDMRADLSYADLSHADLSYVDLSYADLSHADLSYVDLSYADLSHADLSHANLSGADLRGAYLSHANLSGTYLSGTYLKDVDLNGANLSGADLSGVYLRDANLSHTNLSGAYLSGVDLNGAYLRGARNMPFVPQTCPEVGAFIGFKKASGHIVKLEILSDARRCSATGRMCRCDKARVLDIQNINIDEPCRLTEVASSYDNSFVYRVGEIVEEPEFDEDRWNECSKGIHFFINRQEAVDYIS